MQKFTPFWHKMLKIASACCCHQGSGRPAPAGGGGPRGRVHPPGSCAADRAGGAYDAPPDPLIVRDFLHSAIAASRLRRLHFPQISQDLSPPKLHTDFRLWTVGLPKHDHVLKYI